MTDQPTLPRGGSSAALVAGFASAVAMWGVGFFCRLPMDTGGHLVPSVVLFALLLVLLLAGAAWAARSQGVRAGAGAGFVTALLNMLVLGSLLQTETGQRAPTLWLLAFLASGVLLGAIGGWLGVLSARSFPPVKPAHWPGRFGVVAAVATSLLLAVGGLVTSGQAGLAVPDWPTSYEHNMFLFPLSRMTGGVYLEHSHRLLGSLVGLTTLALAVYVWVVERRLWLKVYAALLVPAVVAQGVMGGLRVTDLSVSLAMAHGIFGQVFFALQCGLAVCLSRSWVELPRFSTPGALIDHRLTRGLVGVLLAQLFLGSLFRHTDQGIMFHIGIALLVQVVALVTALRMQSARDRVAPVRTTALVIFLIPPVQITLGFIAWAVRGPAVDAQEAPSRADIVFSTVHQCTGALLLATSVVAMLWVHRFFAPIDGEAAG